MKYQNVLFLSSMNLPLSQILIVFKTIFQDICSHPEAPYFSASPVFLQSQIWSVRCDPCLPLKIVIGFWGSSLSECWINWAQLWVFWRKEGLFCWPSLKALKWTIVPGKRRSSVSFLRQRYLVGQRLDMSTSYTQILLHLFPGLSIFRQCYSNFLEM